MLHSFIMRSPTLSLSLSPLLGTSTSSIARALILDANFQVEILTVDKYQGRDKVCQTLRPGHALHSNYYAACGNDRDTFRPSSCEVMFLSWQDCVIVSLVRSNAARRVGKLLRWLGSTPRVFHPALNVSNKVAS